MAAVRRSTRLSSASKAATPTPTTTTTIPQRSDVWRRRQPRHTAPASGSGSDSDDGDSDDNNNSGGGGGVDGVGGGVVGVVGGGGCGSGSERTAGQKNENYNFLNKMDVAGRSGSRKSKAPKDNAGAGAGADTAKTPRSSKATRPMPASRKRELASKRQTAPRDEPDSEDAADDGGDSALQSSPPKQTRQHKPLAQHLISPSRLLDRLSIDERSDETAAALAEPQQQQDEQAPPTGSAKKYVSPPRNKYQNARRVLNSAETQHLPGREEQLQQLRAFFAEHLDEQRSGSLYVSGQPGTGKTACLSLLLRAPEFAHRLQRVYINCTSIASVGGVYKKLCAELEVAPSGRTERDHLAAIQKYLRCAPRMLLIVMDEIDQLCSARQSVLYTIFEWPALPGARLLLVGIANSLDLTDRALMRLNARCELKPRLMHFPPYTKQQIVDIFKARLQEADVLDVFPPVTLQLLAAKVSAVSGDVRRALDIGRRVVEIAEQQKDAGKQVVNLNELNFTADDAPAATQPEAALKPVQVTQVAAVLNKVYGASQNLQEDIEESFPMQQKLMICSLMLMLRKERHKDISMGRLHEVYRRVCTKRNILALDQAEFAGLVDLVETRGILRILRKKEPRLSKVQLQWDEDEVNGALMDKQLIASILDDTACLAK